jgi:hypothetical protein
MRNDGGERCGLTPASFVSEVQDFREFVADPAPTLAEKKRALGVIVTHAATLDPSDAGFASDCSGESHAFAGIDLALWAAEAQNMEDGKLTRKGSDANPANRDPLKRIIIG